MSIGLRLLLRRLGSLEITLMHLRSLDTFLSLVLVLMVFQEIADFVIDIYRQSSQRTQISKKKIN